MTGQQGYIYQKNNKLPDAVITADVSPSITPPLIYPVQKQGNGNIRLYGQYNGAVDARYELKILDTTLEKPIVSAPTFKGAGTGKISDIIVSELQAQKIHVLCLSTGTDTTQAEIDIEGLKFRAKQEGIEGNNIYIIIDDSMLQFTQTDYSTIKALKVGDTALEGQEWDFDTKVLQGENIPSDAHRIAFGQDQLHIYLQYKKFEDGKWKYYFIMPIQYEIKAGSRVYFVTSGRKVTVTNGVDTEVYEDIVTIADFWTKIKSSSSLIEPVDSSIDTSRNISSPAVREFATKTDAYSLPPYKNEKSSDYAGELESIVVNNNTKTELFEIKCVDNAYVGAEIWDVKGSSSGELGQARTGELSIFAPVAFTIPQKFPKDWGKEKEDWSYKIKYATRGQGVDPPAICFAMKLGINAAPQTLTLEYKKKPPECNCPPVSFSDKCLGLEEEGGEIGMAYTVPDLFFWTDVVAERMREKWAEGEVEAYEGREAYSMAYPQTVGFTASYYGFTKPTSEYFKFMKNLAQRIMNLPEDNPTTLQTMVDNFKQLVNSLKIYSGPSSIATWNGTQWINQTSYQVKDVSYDTDIYQSLVDSVLLYERTYGVKKNSIITGTCYVDAGGDYYWEVRGAKAYLPAFTDTPYYSTVRSGDEYINTKEFAFLVSTPCGGALLEGDQIEVTIGGRLLERTYQVGDITYLPTIAKQNLYFHGGIDGDDLYTFEVKGELNFFPDYILDRDNPERYYQSNLQFQIEDGIIPFQVSDIFEFAVEGGHFIWRKDSGAWSSALDIQQDIQALDSGLQIGFEFGVSPSFVQNDTWEILCVQENRAANLITPWIMSWKGTGNLVFSYSQAVTIDTLVIALHNLTGTITFQTSNEEDFDPLLHDEQITVTDLICKLYLGVNAIEAKYFRLLLGSGEHEIGYFFLGNLMQLSLDADKIRPLRRYQMSRQAGKEPFSLYNYLNRGFNVEYSSFIYNTDWLKLDEMIQYLKENNDMPLYFIANINYPGECIRAYIDTDNIEPGSDIDYNAPEENRLYTLTLPIVGVK